MMNFFRRHPPRATIEALYGAIVAQARHPAFYRNFGVPDSLQGRLDLLMLHLALVFDRLSEGPPDARRLGQALFERFCRDMDDHLREQGTSDLKVPKEVGKLAGAFMGRQKAYLSALKASDRASLQQALIRNVYQGNPVDAAAGLTIYVETAARQLSDQADAVASGRVSWPEPGDMGSHNQRG